MGARFVCYCRGGWLLPTAPPGGMAPGRCGAPFRVTGTRQNGDETIVTSQIARQSGPAELQWHVADRGGHFVVTDVQVNGASMRVSERDQLAGIMQRNGGRPDALLSVMRQQTAHTGAPQRPGAMPPGGAVGSSQPPRQ